MRLLPAIVIGISICPAALGGTFVYSHERSTSNGSRVFGLRVDGTAVTELNGGTPLTTSGSVSFEVRGNLGSIAYSPKRKTLFVANGSGIVALRVAKSGQLSEVAGSPFGAADFVGLGVAEFRKRVFVYGASRATDQIVGFEVTKSGTLVDLGTPASCGVGPRQVKVAGNVLATLCTDDTLWVFKVNPSGALTHDANGFAADESMGFANTDVAINPNKKTVYVVSANTAVYPYHVGKANGAYDLTALPFNALAFSNYGAIAMISSKACLIARGSSDPEDADMFAAGIGPTGSVDELLNLPQSSFLDTIDAFACGPRQRVVVASSDTSDRTYLFHVDPKDGSLGFLDSYGIHSFDAPENFTGSIVISR